MMSPPRGEGPHCLRSEKKSILILSGNFGSKQVGRTLKHFSKFSDEKWRNFFFTFYLIKRVNWVPPGIDSGD